MRLSSESNEGRSGDEVAEAGSSLTRRNMSIRYRQATLEDAIAIADLHTRSWRATYRGSYRDEYLDGPVEVERLEVWTARLADPPSNQFVVVAEDDAGVIGFACAYGDYDAEGSFLDNIHADPRRHGEGIGTGLFMAVVEWCREHYAEHALYLKVLARNVNARRFYERFSGIDRGSTPASSEWIVEGVEIRRYMWDTLGAVSDRGQR
jgi:GNAT superfamily N-acetyltransferase